LSAPVGHAVLLGSPADYKRVLEARIESARRLSLALRGLLYSTSSDMQKIHAVTLSDALFDFLTLDLRNQLEHLEPPQPSASIEMLAQMTAYRDQLHERRKVRDNLAQQLKAKGHDELAAMFDAFGFAGLDGEIEDIESRISAMQEQLEREGMVP